MLVSNNSGGTLPSIDALVPGCLTAGDRSVGDGRPRGERREAYAAVSLIGVCGPDGLEEFSFDVLQSRRLGEKLHIVKVAVIVTEKEKART